MTLDHTIHVLLKMIDDSKLLTSDRSDPIADFTPL